MFMNFLAGGALRQPSFFGSAVSDSSSITIPANAPARALAVLLDFSFDNPGPPTKVVPTGFTQAFDKVSPGNNYRATVSHRLLSAGEGGTSKTGMSHTPTNKIMFVFRGPFRAVSFKGEQNEWTSGNPITQTHTLVGKRRPLIFIGYCQEIGANAEFTTASPAFDAEVETASGDLNAGYKIYGLATLTANHSIDMADLGTLNKLGGFYYECW